MISRLEKDLRGSGTNSLWTERVLIKAELNIEWTRGERSEMGKKPKDRFEWSDMANNN